MSTELATTTATTSNTLNVYSKVNDPVVFANEMAIAACSMMNAPVDQGKAIALHALCEGLTLVEMGRRYHWIGGKPSMRADAMLAEFKLNHGGRYTIHERTPEKCSVSFYDAEGVEFKAEVTWEEIKQSRWPWKNWQAEDKVLKDNWATPLDQKAMMFARLVSDSLRAFCPELVAGVYTPEELQDVAAVDAPPHTARPTVAQLAANAQPAATAQPSAPAGDTVTGHVVRAVEETTAGQPEPASEAEPAGEVVANEELSPTDPGSINERQVERIDQLFDALGFSAEKRADILAKRSAKVIRNLSAQQAQEVIDRMQAAQQQQLAAAGATSPAGN